MWRSSEPLSDILFTRGFFEVMMFGATYGPNAKMGRPRYGDIWEILDTGNPHTQQLDCGYARGPFVLGAQNRGSVY